MIKKATTPQIRKIYALAKELNLDNDLLHEFTYNVIKKDSISKLTNVEAITLIDELEYKKTGVRKEKTYRSNRATEDQIYKIKALELELGWRENPNRLKGFMKKYSKIDNINWLTFNAASNLIEALKKIKERERKKNFSN